MQEKLKKAISETEQQTERSVILCLHSKLIILDGIWNWDMQCDAVYCSDVMSFPESFEGTRGIIHPDDINKIRGAIDLLGDHESLQMDFRMISTYGEVHVIRGEKVFLNPWKLNEPLPIKEAWQEKLQQLADLKESGFLQLTYQLSDFTEQLTGVGGWLVNKETAETWYSDNVFRIYKLAPQSLNAHANTFYSFIHPEDRVMVQDAFDKSYSREVPVHLEYRILLPDGELVFVSVMTNCFFNRKGQVIFAGIIKDVTRERALADELIAAQSFTFLNQQLMKFSGQQCAVGYFSINLVSRKTSFSESYCRIYGIKQATLPASHSFVSLVYFEDRERIKDLSEKMYTEHVLPETEFRIVRPDGKMRYLKQSGKLFAQPGADLTMIGVVQDITNQKSLEKKIEEYLASIQHLQVAREMTEFYAGASSIFWLPDGYMQWSDGFYRMLGHKPGNIESLSRLLYISIYPSDLQIFKDAEVLIHSHRVPEPIVIRLVSRAGIKPVKIIFKKPDQSDELLVGLVMDVANITGLETLLIENKSLLDLVMSSVNDVMILTNDDHIITAWNDKAALKTGIAKEDALHQHLLDVLPRLDDEQFMGQLQTASKGNAVHTNKPANNLYLKKPHLYRLLPLKDDEEKTIAVLHVVQDVSKESELQAELGERLNFIENLLESSVDRIIVLDRFMNYLFWNKKAEEYYAVNKKKVLGKNILEVFPAFRNHHSYQELRKALKGETIYLPPGGMENEEYAETYLVPIKDADGNVTALLWIVHDLSERLKAEKKLQKEHKRFRESEAIGHVGSFEWIVATDVINWSDEMYRIYGIPQGETITTEKVIALIHPDDLAELKDKTEECKAAPCNITVTYRLLNGNSETKIVTQFLQSFFDNEGNLTHMAGTVQDVTKIKNSENLVREKSWFLQRIQEAVPDMMSVANLQTMEFEYLNVGAYQAQGFDAGELSRLNFEERLQMIHPDDRKALQTYFQQLAAASDADVITTEYRAQNFAGEWKWLLAKGRVFQRNKKGAVTHALNIIENITTRKSNEQEILGHVRYMVAKEAELKELNKTLEQRNTELEQKNEEITHFSFVASHDMQEPLRKIQTFANWILEQEAGHLSPQAKNFTRKMIASVNRMEKLIEDVLILTKIHKDQHRNEDVNLEDVLNMVKEEMANEIRYSEAEITSGQLPVIKANGNQLLYLFKNLVSNAIKFQEAGSIPQLNIVAEVVSGQSLSQANSKGQFLKLSFTDNGLGFEKRQAKKIFQVFQRLHNESEYEGTGIGLAICKKIMENHEGWITAESEKGKGSSFYCFFPLE